MSRVDQASDGAARSFDVAARAAAEKRKKRPAPLSLRLSAKERAKLEEAARGLSLTAYIKSMVFKPDGQARPARHRMPVKDHKALARALGLLGALDLAKSLGTLSEAAKSGGLPVTPETEAELVAACAAVLAIKSELMQALGYKDDGSP